MCELKKTSFNMGVYRLHFFYLQPKLIITFNRWEKAIVSDSHGLEKGYDLVPHINTPLCIFFVFPVNSKPKINPCEETSHIIHFHE